MYLNGSIGQVIGPFSAGEDLLAEGGDIMAIINSKTMQLIKLGIQTAQGTIVKINGTNVKIGKTGIYELDETVAIKSLIFPNGANANTIIDFVY